MNRIANRPHVVPKRISRGGQNGDERKIGENERPHAAETGIGFRRRRERGCGIGPDGGGRDPAERVGAEQRHQRQREHPKPDGDRQGVFAEPGGFGRLNGYGCVGNGGNSQECFGYQMIYQIYRLNWDQSTCTTRVVGR